MHLKNSSVTQESISNSFFDYLKEHMENYPIGSDEREIILTLFCIGYKRQPRKEVLFRNWNLYNYSETYSPDQAMALCEKFIKEDLKLDMNFPKAIAHLKVAYPKTTAP